MKVHFHELLECVQPRAICFAHMLLWCNSDDEYFKIKINKNSILIDKNHQECLLCSFLSHHAHTLFSLRGEFLIPTLFD